MSVHDDRLIADDELGLSVERARRASLVQFEDLEVSVLLGLVKLRGRVATAQDREVAERIARAVPCVESVANDLEVQDARVRG